VTHQEARLSARLDYVELPLDDFPASKAFFENAFGWALKSYGPDYAVSEGPSTELGLNGHSTDLTSAPLPAIRVDDLEMALARVEAAGGNVTRAIFAFPGGRRFHFREPSGNELAVYVNEAG